MKYLVVASEKFFLETLLMVSMDWSCFVNDSVESIMLIGSVVNSSD